MNSILKGETLLKLEYNLLKFSIMCEHETNGKVQCFKMAETHPDFLKVQILFVEWA